MLTYSENTITSQLLVEYWNLAKLILSYLGYI